MSAYDEDWEEDDESELDDGDFDPDAEFLSGRLLIAMPGIEDPASSRRWCWCARTRPSTPWESP
jgi:hypothetical protein